MKQSPLQKGKAQNSSGNNQTKNSSIKKAIEGHNSNDPAARNIKLAKLSKNTL